MAKHTGKSKQVSLEEEVPCGSVVTYYDTVMGTPFDAVVYGHKDDGLCLLVLKPNGYEHVHDVTRAGDDTPKGHWTERI